MSYLRWFCSCFILVFLMIGGTPHASSADSVKDAQANTAPVVDTKAIRASFDKHKIILDSIEKSLNAGSLSDEQLRRWREQVAPVIEDIQKSLVDIAPRVSGTKARLDQLGSKPKDGAAEESQEVANERAEKESIFAELSETQRLGNVILVQASQLLAEMSNKRRVLFQQRILKRSQSILSPDLWFSVISTFPKQLTSVGGLALEWAKQIRANATFNAVFLLTLAMCLWFTLFAGKIFITKKFIRRDPDVENPSSQKKILAAIAVIMLRTVPAVVGSVIVYNIFTETRLIPDRLDSLVKTILFSVASFTFLNALSDAILAPSARPWRLVSIVDTTASRLRYYVLLLTIIVLAGKVAEAFYQALDVELQVSIASRGVFSLSVAAILITLLKFAISGKVNEESLAAYSAAESEVGGPLRMIGWLMIISIIGSALFGYVALSSFLVDQGIWMAVLFAVLRLLLAFTNAFIDVNVTNKSATFLQANTGLTRSSLEQTAVIINGALRVFLILVAIMAALAPLGIESFDYALFLRSAFFGFQVGDITISISTMVLAVAIFFVGSLLTRLMQQWLEHTYLPATTLDAGLRNSIKTGFGYVGIIVVALATLSYTGINLSNITIVAGALSVGVGFGLQSIVNNFVSGLILLWERPIRVGDLVVVGDGEGHVRHISVRSTEIITSDRTTIIVPNSNLISGVVRNRVRGDRMGRIAVSVPVNRGVDPDNLVAIVKKCALNHREVASVPAPNVLFKKIGEATLEFELVCFVEEIESSSQVSSDLHFVIFNALREAGIIPMPSPTTLTLQGLEAVANSIGALAGKRGSCVSSQDTKPAPTKRKAGKAGDEKEQSTKSESNDNSED